MKIKISTLSKNNDFRNILGGKKVSNEYLTIFFEKIPSKNKNSFNMSIITKKKLGNAVLRNKIKRRLRNIIREAVKSIKLNLEYSYLFMAKKNIFEDNYDLIKKDIFKGLKKIK